jgi:transcriptional antiterminator NusG
MKNLGITQEPVVSIDVEVGDSIEVIAGAWEGTISTVTSINMAKQTVTIDVDIFGRATSVEIGFTEIKKM